MKTIYTLFLCFIFLAGCNTNKDAELRIQIQRMHQDSIELANENFKLRQEIQKLHETDQYYYHSSVDSFNAGQFEKAMDLLNQMKTKFPNSPLISAGDKLIINIKTQLVVINRREQQYLDDLLHNAEKVDVEEAISKLQSYVSEAHPSNLLQKASQALLKYKQDYEIVKTERESEHFTGIKLTSVTSMWDWREGLLVPQLQLKFKNISNAPIEHLSVKANFINVGSSEVFGEANAYVVGYGDTPLQPGYTKTAYLYCGVGYQNDYGAISRPPLTADIYVNEKFYRKIKVLTGY